MKILLLAISLILISPVVSAEEFVRISDQQVKRVKTHVVEQVYDLESLQRGRQILVNQIAEIDELIATIKGTGR